MKALATVRNFFSSAKNLTNIQLPFVKQQNRIYLAEKLQFIHKSMLLLHHIF